MDTIDVFTFMVLGVTPSLRALVKVWQAMLVIDQEKRPSYKIISSKSQQTYSNFG
jgi:hypothetical protein